MPSFEEHVAKATANIDFLESFAFKKANDWAITVMFYTALHIMEAIIWKKTNYLRQHDQNFDIDIHCPNHSCRERVVKELFPEIHFQYTQLSKSAHDGRYKVYKFKDQAVICNIENYFKPIIIFFNQFAITEKINKNITCKI
jgi:hypothetical protein